MLCLALFGLVLDGCSLDRSPLGPDAQRPLDAAHAPTDDAGGDPSTCTPGPELCNGVDDDCDPTTPDGADEVGAPCDAGDVDQCEDGSWQCVGGALVCSDDDDSATEHCNAVDDDCDMEVDEDAGCPCKRATYGGGTYLFCTASESWQDARDACRELGYELVTIDDAAENEWVSATAAGESESAWWIGASDVAEEGVFVWLNGAPVAYSNWAPREPNNLLGEDCIELRPRSAGASGTPGAWNDVRCTANNAFVCEAP